MYLLVVGALILTSGCSMKRGGCCGGMEQKSCCAGEKSCGEWKESGAKGSKDSCGGGASCGAKGEKASSCGGGKEAK